MKTSVLRHISISAIVGLMFFLSACGGSESTDDSSSSASEAPSGSKSQVAASGSSESSGSSGDDKTTKNQQSPSLQAGKALQQHSIYTTPAIGSLLGREIPPGRMTRMSVPQPITKNYPDMEINPDKTYKMIIEMEKGKGTIEILLHSKEAPMSANSLVHLARQGFYDGLIFHRVIHETAAETGDPRNRGCCGPGYEFDNEPNPNLRFDGPGVVGMMNRGYTDGYGTNGSQFFIAYTALPFLDSYNADGTLKNCQDKLVTCHTVVGKVISGMDILQALIPRNPVSSGQVPGEKMSKVTIVEE